MKEMQSSGKRALSIETPLRFRSNQQIPISRPASLSFAPRHPPDAVQQASAHGITHGQSSWTIISRLRGQVHRHTPERLISAWTPDNNELQFDYPLLFNVLFQR